MRKRSYMFTGRSHSDRGKLSAILGAISFVSVCLIIYLSYRWKGAMSPKLGAAAFFAMLISIGGETLAILSRIEKDKFYVFPNLGIFLNGVSLFVIICLLYMGLYDI